MFYIRENIYRIATNVIWTRCVNWMRMEALKAMTVQIKDSKTSQNKLDNCVINEANSDTHVLDISGVVSRVAIYADALHREASRRCHARREAALLADNIDEIYKAA